ncbi:MAG TPA: DUF4232 domain-containing protein [Solirubrobacteraceae bacterium]|nr:DUF4232 domain-containing protein [Solirubrobacteraceae bacterium]
MVATAIIGGQAVAAGRAGGAQRPSANASAAARCQGRRLRITLAVASPGVSHHGYVLRFQNKGSACTIGGYPGVDGLSAQGQRVLSARRTKSGYLGGVGPSHPIPRVPLAKGKTASAIVEWVDLGPPCPRVQSLKVTAPDSVVSVQLAPKSLESETLCDVEVHPVVPGRSGQEP